jgi:hypothetical protein
LHKGYYFCYERLDIKNPRYMEDKKDID